MVVHFNPDEEARIAQLAADFGLDPQSLVKDAILGLLREEDERFRNIVLEGKAYAERGEFIEEEEMDARMEEMLRR